MTLIGKEVNYIALQQKATIITEPAFHEGEFRVGISFNDTGNLRECRLQDLQILNYKKDLLFELDWSKIKYDFLVMDGSTNTWYSFEMDKIYYDYEKDDWLIRDEYDFNFQREEISFIHPNPSKSLMIRPKL